MVSQSRCSQSGDLLAGQHLLQKGVWTLEMVQQSVKTNHGHLQKKETKKGVNVVTEANAQ